MTQVTTFSLPQGASPGGVPQEGHPAGHQAGPGTVRGDPSAGGGTGPAAKASRLLHGQGHRQRAAVQSVQDRRHDDVLELRGEK